MKMFVDVFCVAALMLCCSRLSHGRPPAHSPSLTEHTTVSHPAPHYAPCLVDDIFAALRESVGNDDELTNSSVYQFGVCTASARSSVLLQLAKETRRNHRDGLEVLPPTGVILAEENERGALLLTFDLPQSPSPNPMLLLVFESPLTGGNLDVTFSSPSLHPNTQSVCISEKTQYIMLTGKASEGGVHHRWRMSIETKKPDMNQSLRDILIGGKSGSTTSMTPLLLFSGEGGTETRYHTSSPASSQTPFLCELKRFLGDVPPQDTPESPVLQLDSLDSLDSLPPLPLDLSSSDTLLAELINSPSPTIVSFTSRGPMFQVHLGELAMSPALLQEVKQRLQQTVTQVTEVIETEGEVGCRATKRLRRLTELCVSREGACSRTGVSQYRAFLLLRALQTVARGYEMQRSLRSTRDSTGKPVNANTCGLKSLTVSLFKAFLGPNTARINNCQGPCVFPLSNPTYHASLLNSYIENGNVEERAPCCVPTAYDTLVVIKVKPEGTYICLQPNMLASECGCR
ncbi:LOW QUALITY PROTEIN: muellerian-inhibiting factor [Pseudochaenichthys georgianus]|uniref:LOW QUALITY PROTEIN: muellerian-inhibiting factor n=1 Tax=Pseudochaenichthys georgianus TaxID=52239 RepID=UPI00146D9F3D|nr:LOW QUALITY PROTEIN: muellerian-inhibiting factor [Pseudochaenichthys georgianus]